MSTEPRTQRVLLSYPPPRPLPPGRSLRQKQLADNKAVLLCLYLFSFAMVSTVYVVYTSQVWAYIGLNLSINIGKIVASILLLSAFVVATPVKWNARTFFLNLILTTYLLPSLILYGFADRPTMAALVVWTAVAIVYLVSGIRIPRTTLFSLSPRIVMWILLALSATFIGAFFFLGGFRYFNLDFSRVYDLRDEAAASLPEIFMYLSTTFSNTIIPFGIAISMYYRNSLNAILFALVSIIMFGLTTHKVMLFTPIFVAAIYFFLSYRPRYATILYGFSILTAVVAISVLFIPYFSINSLWGWLEGLFIRRILMVPAMLDFSYIEFFSENAQYYWSTSKITMGLLGVPHNGVSPPEIIGLVHFGTTVSWADRGFIGSGFAQAGFLGTVIYATATGLTIAVFQAFSERLGVPIVASATLGLFTTMIHSSDFVSLFLTHGLLLALLILTSLRDGARDSRTLRSPAGRRPVFPAGKGSRPLTTRIVR